MALLCGTRAVKNAKEIMKIAPGVFAAQKPNEGFASVVPLDVLRRFNRMTDDELKGMPELLQVSQTLRQRQPPPVGVGREPHGLIFSDSPFKGTLYFAQITFKVGANTISISDADMATIMQYGNDALPAISKYCAQYGDNSLALSSKILKLTVDVPSGKYDDGALQGWVRTLLGQATTPAKSSCVVVFNPNGVVNSDGALSDGVGGYHDNVTVMVGQQPFPTFVPSPYCFVNVTSTGLTVADRADRYVDTLSHEIAEMVCDPYVSWTNPEVCDGCAGNCRNSWKSLFRLSPGEGYAYLQSVKGGIPATIAFDFFTAAVAQKDHADDCPVPEAGCAYAPSARAGAGELLFYEAADGYSELYAVDARSNISLQTTHTDWRSSWTLIVPGAYTPKPVGSRLDLLFYDRAAGWGEFYQTGMVGDMHQFSVHNNWRTSWSLIIPGSFSKPGAMDLLFYEPSDGFGEYNHTDGKGSLTLIRDQPGWRGSWSIILPGRFSNSGLTDLLFYDPGAGVGEFYKMGPNGAMSLLKSISGWRTSWKIIVPGKFSNSGFTDLLFYDPSSGTGEFYSTDGHGGMTLLRTFTNWRTSWSMIVPLKITGGAFTDLLFYDPSGGVGEFYSTDGHGGINMIQSHTNWRTTWTMIKAL